MQFYCCYKNWIYQKLNPSSRGWAYPHPLTHHADMPFGIRQIPSVNSSATNSSLVTASDHLRRFRSSGFQPFSSFSAAGYSGSSPSKAVCARIIPSIRKQQIRTFEFCFLLRLRLSLRRQLLPAASIALVCVCGGGGGPTKISTGVSHKSASRPSSPIWGGRQLKPQRLQKQRCPLAGMPAIC